ncbi:hypothetical protein K2173_027355 [Erythroxylum novogranatense]|uniref:Single-stranded DNA-binding protein, mitochondrial n=1 Tax=Erythroxylum novogranatense TaxID=1862640 RepID=A0AAV8U1E8_9ROSI|nr:hypothetical protein K2173_027355 [Erythroxylum novogranatense]
MATLSGRAYRCVLSNPRISQISIPFCTTNLSSSENLDSDRSNSNLDAPCSEVTKKREIYDRPLENGLDLGIYKAILVGRVGQSPVQKKLKGGTTVTLLSVGTGGIRSYRKPMENEDPKDYANRGTVQWHRVSVYPARLGDLVVKHIVPGAILYVEGNLETKVFSDPITGLVRRVREVAVRRNGRIVFLNQGSMDQQASPDELKGVGYY